jgi:hypothetical protein
MQPLAMADTSAHPSRCRNCGADAPSLYCPSCGQETRVALPTVREIMRDATGRLVALDSRLWRTLAMLVLQPGMLTAEYLRGRRRRYVRPARLFFVTAIVLFAVVRMVLPPMEMVTLDLDVDKPVTQGRGNAPASASAAPDRGTTAPVDPDVEEALSRYGRFLPREWVGRIQRFERAPKPQQIEQVFSGMIRYAPYGMVVLLPAFALLQYLAYLPGRRRHPQRPSRYAEYLVYAAHLHAFVFLMLIVTVLLPIPPVRWAIAAWILVYAIRAGSRIYGGGWLSVLARLVPVGAVYLLLLLLAMSALLVLSIATS